MDLNSFEHLLRRAAGPCVAGVAALVLSSCARPPDIGVGRLHVCAIDEGPRGDSCGSLTVAEDRAAPKGRTIDVKIVVARALRRDPKPDPVFILYGGPTGGAATMAGSLAPMFRLLQADRDIVFVDQRGTGASNPLDCEPPERTLAALVEASVDRFRTCLEHVDADPRFYSTVPAMDDIDEVRRHLGYGEINLWGASYGTRAALVYLSRHESAVRSIVLDSAGPIDLALPLSMARTGQRALDRLVADCAADAACARRFPGFGATVSAVLERAGDGSTVRVTHPRTGEAIAATISRQLVAQTILYALYSPTTASLLPLWLSDAARGDFQGLLSLRLIEGPAAAGTGEGAFLSVFCSEDAPRFTREEAIRQASGTFLGTTQLDTLFKPCEFWPRAAVAPDFYTPPKSNKPVLVLSGDLDPVLPPAYGEAVAKSLPNAHHLVVPATGHGTSVAGCVPKLIEKFVTEADAGGLDPSCLNGLRRPPFITNRTGGANP